MQKIINLNRSPFLRDRLILSLGLITLLCLWITYSLSVTAGGWLELHEQAFQIIFIELLPFIMIGFLLFITSSRYHAEREQSMDETRSNLIRNVAATLGKIKTGQYNKDTDVTGEAEVDTALRDIYEKFRSDADEERHRSWMNEGLALFRQIMSTHTQIKPMCEEINGRIVKYMNAAQGGIFMLNAEGKLELMSCYAFERKKYLQRIILPGEGLTGQCFLEGHRIYMTKVPDNYVNITSGLGAANPQCLLILPLKLKDTILGVLEIASFKPFSIHQLELMDKTAEALAQSISTINSTENTKLLLDKSLEREHEMKDQEEKMKQSLEELYVTQEDMRKMNREMEEIFKAINTLTATVELNPEGEIIKLNDRFLQTLHYDAQELYGNPLSTFLSSDKDGKEMLLTNWNKILDGTPVEKVFTFEDAAKQKRWLRTGFYPLRGQSGTERILCFLNDVSEIVLKEIELDKVNKEMELFRKMLIRILNEIPLKIFLKQYDGKFFIVNDAVSSFHGFDTADGLIGKSDFDFYDAKDATEWLAAEHKIISEGRTEYIHADGGKILRTVKMPFFIDPLQETGLLGFQADVTELEQLKKQLTQKA